MQILIITFLATFLRLLFIGHFADQFDAVDFALGILNFDVYSMQPHFPGYPLHMLLGYGVNTWLHDPVRSLSVISAVSGGLLVVPVYFLTRDLLGKRPAVMVSWLVCLNPFLWIYSLQPMSDMPGVLFVMASMALLVSAGKLPYGSKKQWMRASLAVAIFGWAMGIRLSYFPFGLAFLLFFIDFPRNLKGYLLLFTVGIISVGSWMLPTAIHEGGMGHYLGLGETFTEGHFSDWGGTAFQTEGSLPFFERIRITIGEHLLAMGGFGVLRGVNGEWVSWLFCILAGLGFFYILYRRSIRPFAVLLFFIPYTVWILVGQNVDKPRHVLILLPFFFMAAVSLLFLVIKNKWGQTGILLLVLLAFSWVGWKYADAYHHAVPSTVQLTRYLKNHYFSSPCVVYTWEEGRVIGYYEPKFRTVQVKTPAYFLNQVLVQASDPAVKILVTNHVLDGFGIQKDEFMPYLKKVAEFKSNPVFDPVYHDIVLYEAKPSFILWAKTRK